MKNIENLLETFEEKILPVVFSHFRNDNTGLTAFLYTISNV